MEIPFVKLIYHQEETKTNYEYDRIICDNIIYLCIYQFGKKQLANSYVLFDGFIYKNSDILNIPCSIYYNNGIYNITGATSNIMRTTNNALSYEEQEDNYFNLIKQINLLNYVSPPKNVHCQWPLIQTIPTLFSNLSTMAINNIVVKKIKNNWKIIS